MTGAATTRRTCGGLPRRGLWRLDASHPYRRRDPTHGVPSPEPEDFQLCLALLEEAIARAERWMARREHALAELDARAAGMVNRLRNAGVLAASTTWASV
jgi:hypothetical protein